MLLCVVLCPLYETFWNFIRIARPGGDGRAVYVKFTAAVIYYRVYASNFSCNSYERFPLICRCVFPLRFHISKALRQRAAFVWIDLGAWSSLKIYAFPCKIHNGALFSPLIATVVPIEEIIGKYYPCLFVPLFIR